MSQRNDFRITYTSDDDSSVSFESTANSSFTSGYSFVCQRVLHSLFSSPGEVSHDLEWGAGLLDLFKISGNLRDSGVYNSYITNCLKKATSDVKRVQPPELNSDSKLKALELISIEKRYSDGSLEVKIRVILENGDSTELVI